MLTIFATPKAFRGQFENIQLNAITSWTLLEPRPEIILFGDDPGTAEVAARLGVRHHAEIETNEHGTPRVDLLFAKGQELASNDLVCYVNSDIILTQAFMDGVSAAVTAADGRLFLGVGRKTSLPIDSLLDFGDPAWSSDLTAWAEAEGQEVTYDSDFFLFRRGHWKAIPPFAIGRCYWSSWFVYDTRRRGIDVFDMTPMVLTVEPRHDYSHASSTGGHARLSGVEFKANRRLFHGCHYFTTVNATRVLADGRLSEPPASYWLRSLGVRFEYYVYFLLKGELYPYSLPLIVMARWVAAGLRLARRGPRHFVRPLPRGVLR